MPRSVRKKVFIMACVGLLVALAVFCRALGAVLTNDLHQLVFAFPAHAGVWSDSEYSYAAAYWFVIGWEILCALTALSMMLIKSRVPRKC